MGFYITTLFTNHQNFLKHKLLLIEMSIGFCYEESLKALNLFIVLVGV